MASGGPGFEYFVHCWSTPCADESKWFHPSCKRKSGLSFYWDTGMLIVYGCALYAGVHTGSLLTVAWVYSGVSLLNFIVGRWLMAYVIQLDMKVYVKSLVKPAVMTLLMAGHSGCSSRDEADISGYTASITTDDWFKCGFI